MRNIFQIQEVVNWIDLAVKQNKAETVSKRFLKVNFGEDCVLDAVKEARKNLISISNICDDIHLPCNTDSFIRFDFCFATQYNFESATAFLSVTNAGKEEEK